MELLAAASVVVASAGATVVVASAGATVVVASAGAVGAASAAASVVVASAGATVVVASAGASTGVVCCCSVPSLSSVLTFSFVAIISSKLFDLELQGPLLVRLLAISPLKCSPSQLQHNCVRFFIACLTDFDLAPIL